jgi:hypothetical protein
VAKVEDPDLGASSSSIAVKKEKARELSDDSDSEFEDAGEESEDDDSGEEGAAASGADDGSAGELFAQTESKDGDDASTTPSAVE